LAGHHANGRIAVEKQRADNAFQAGARSTRISFVTERPAGPSYIYRNDGSFPCGTTLWPHGATIPGARQSFRPSCVKKSRRHRHWREMAGWRRDLPPEWQPVQRRPGSRMARSGIAGVSTLREDTCAERFWPSAF
jgi:hypothetical protein